MGAKDLSQAELQYPGWLSNLLTHPIQGLEKYRELMRTVTEAKDALKSHL